MQDKTVWKLGGNITCVKKIFCSNMSSQEKKHRILPVVKDASSSTPLNKCAMFKFRLCSVVKNVAYRDWRIPLVTKHNRLFYGSKEKPICCRRQEIQSVDIKCLTYIFYIIYILTKRVFRRPGYIRDRHDNLSSSPIIDHEQRHQQLGPASST